MALHHAASGEPIDVRPLGDRVLQTPSTALVRTGDFEVMRMILPAGKSVPEHQVAGELTIQCLEGTVELQAHDKTQSLRAGDMVYLAGAVPHALHAVENASILVTMLRKDREEKQGPG